MTGATPGPRHPRCGGEWRGPFDTDSGSVEVCNTCGDERPTWQSVHVGNCEGVRGDGHSCTSGTIPGRRARWRDPHGRLLCGTCRKDAVR